MVSRLVSSLAKAGPAALAAIRDARASARERAWALAGDAAPGADGGPVVTDLDATIVIARSEKEQVAPTWKKTFGHHPMTAWADHGEAGNGEPLALVLRAGNAGPDTAAGHIETARLAIAQLPRHLRRTALIRADSGGGTQASSGLCLTRYLANISSVIRCRRGVLPGGKRAPGCSLGSLF